jgi:hypothetical protein
MSFLYPLFLAGIAAVGLPIILHMIRRHTRKRVTFSSLMFLRTTMPRFKNRSRLENLLLLVLRCIILCLLAFAFARPFLLEHAQENPVALAKRIVLLLDTSASMRRAGMWTQAVSQAESVLESVNPVDRVCVMSFDQGTQTLMGFEQWGALDPARRGSVVTEQLSKLSPGWANTDVGSALVAAAEAIEDDEVSGAQQPVWTHEVVLISDLQQGGSLEALRAYQWPEHTQLVVKLVRAKGTTNAAIQLVAGRDGLARPDSPSRSNIRITNSPDATSERFVLSWADEGSTEPSNQAADAYVPAGHSVIVRVPVPSDKPVSRTLVLTGDDHDFDNTFYLAPHLAQRVNILYIGNDDPNDPQGMLYYARRAFAPTGAIDPHLVSRPPQTLADTDIATAHLIIAADAIEQKHDPSLRRYLDSGRTLLLVMKSPDAARTIANLAGVEAIESQEADVDGYAMLGQIDFEHPLLAPFSDSRFADFTGIHFWKYRRVKIAGLPGAEVMAWFDSSDPAWFELNAGNGKVLVLTCGWQPSDSQLALSSKFVPLLYSVLEYGGDALGGRSQYFVGDPVPMPRSIGSGPTPLQSLGLRTEIRKPDGAATVLDGGQRAFTQTDLPGIYSVESSAGSRPFAVNLPARESQTAVMPIEELESLGVVLKQLSIAAVERPVGAAVSAPSNVHDAESRAGQSHRIAFTLESEQKLWRWVFVLLLAVSFVETALAGWLIRAPLTSEGERT